MGRKLYFPVTGVPTGTKFRIDQGGTDAYNAPEALANLNGASADKLNEANGLIKLNGNIKIDSTRIPPGYSGGDSGPMIEGLTSLSINQVTTYTITNYDEFTVYNLVAMDGIASRTGNIINYTAPTGPGLSGFTLNGKAYNINIIQNNAVNRPTVTSPANGATNQPNNINFTSSGFSVSSGSDTHEGSDWQIATDVTFTNIVQQVSNSAANKTSWSATFLNNSTIYYVRVRHKGTNYGYSLWSPIISVATSEVPSYNVSVVGGTISEGQLVTFNINTSNVANNTTLYWTIDTAPSNSTNNSDFISALSGSVLINNNAGTVTVTTLADMLLEGTENFVFALRSGSVAGAVLATFNNSLLDTSYTLAGTQSIVAYNKYDSMTKVAITPDNGILMAGICWRTGVFEIPGYTESRYVVTLMKLNSANQLDTTFGPDNDGKVFIAETNDNNDSNIIAGLHVNASGDIFITGTLLGSGNCFVVKLNSNGIRDNSFGVNGYKLFNLKATFYPNYAPGSTNIKDSVIDNNGDLYLALYINTEANVGSGITAKLTVSTQVISIVGTHSGSYMNEAATTLIAKTSDSKIISYTDKNAQRYLNNHTDSLQIDSAELETLSPTNLNASLAIANFQSGGGFVMLNHIVTESYLYGSDFSLIAFNNDLTIKTSFGTNGIVTINAASLNLGGSNYFYLRDLYITSTHIYAIGSLRTGSSPSDYQAMCVIRLSLAGVLDTTYGNNGIVIVSINNRSDYGRAGVYSTSRNRLVVIGDTDVIINSPSYTNPHNKSGTIGTLQTEIGVIFLDSSGILG